MGTIWQRRGGNRGSERQAPQSRAWAVVTDSSLWAAARRLRLFYQEGMLGGATVAGSRRTAAPALLLASPPAPRRGLPL